VSPLSFLNCLRAPNERRSRGRQFVQTYREMSITRSAAADTNSRRGEPLTLGALESDFTVAGRAKSSHPA
jgi:hypothetical protein